MLQLVLPCALNFTTEKYNSLRQAAMPGKPSNLPALCFLPPSFNRHKKGQR